MNLTLTSEQSMLQEAATRLFATESSPARVRAADRFRPEPAQSIRLDLRCLPVAR